MAMAHTSFSDNMIGKFLYLGTMAFQHRDFETTFVVEVNVQRRLRQVVTFMIIAG